MIFSVATVDNVRAFLPSLTPDQEKQATLLLRVGWRRLLALPGLRVAERIEAGKLDADLVADVLGEMVANVLRNPDGARTRDVSLTIDDYTERESVTIDQARSEGALFPTEAMLMMLRENRRGAWTVRPS